MLKAARYNGCYFDRTEKEADRLCTREGWFTCQVYQGDDHSPEAAMLCLLELSEYNVDFCASIGQTTSDQLIYASSSAFSPPEGSFDQPVCQSLHSINPYGSRESRIVFSTWNLDHRLDV